MPGALPVANGREVVRALRRGGFVVDRIVGSHYVLAHPGDAKRTVVVPVHGSKDLKPGTMRSIIRQSGLSIESFVLLL